MFTAESVPHWRPLGSVSEDEYKALKAVGIFVFHLGRLRGAEPGTLLAPFLSTANYISQKGNRNES